MRTQWAAAEHVAETIELLAHETAEDIDAVLERWTAAYTMRIGRAPEQPMVEAATAKLLERLGGPPALPSSQSSIWVREPDMIRLEDDL